ncbi:hypothetical protein DFH06DRAFT_1292293 [Mycena polygramma]|nr:hypothetical protein DFH06DRAFT_1292293 [Mycena polygramma]
MSESSPSNPTPPNATNAVTPDATPPAVLPRTVWSYLRAKRSHRDDAMDKHSTDIYNHMKSVCLPMVLAWDAKLKACDLGTGKGLTRKKYIADTIYPLLDDKYDISGPDGFVILDFIESITKTFNNWIREVQNHGGVLPSTAQGDGTSVTVATNNAKAGPAPRSRKHTAKDMFKAEIKDKISALVKAELVGVPRTLNDGLDLTKFTALFKARWMKVQTDEKAMKKLEADADAENDKRATSTEKKLAENQAFLGSKIYDALRRLMGDGPKQAGDCCFHVRFATKDKDGVITRRNVSVHRGKKALDLEDKAGSEVFKVWASRILSPGNDNNLPVLDNLLTMEDQPEPEVGHDDGEPTQPPTSTAVDETEDFSPVVVKATSENANVTPALKDFFAPTPAPAYLFGAHEPVDNFDVDDLMDQDVRVPNPPSAPLPTTTPSAGKTHPKSKGPTLENTPLPAAPPAPLPAPTPSAGETPPKDMHVATPPPAPLPAVRLVLVLRPAHCLMAPPSESEEDAHWDTPK